VEPRRPGGALAYHLETQRAVGVAARGAPARPRRAPVAPAPRLRTCAVRAAPDLPSGDSGAEPPGSRDRDPRRKCSDAPPGPHHRRAKVDRRAPDTMILQNRGRLRRRPSRWFQAAREWVFARHAASACSIDRSGRAESRHVTTLSDLLTNSEPTVSRHVRRSVREDMARHRGPGPAAAVGPPAAI